MQAGNTVPYSSDIGVNYGVDEGWITSAARNSTPFRFLLMAMMAQIHLWPALRVG